MRGLGNPALAKNKISLGNATVQTSNKIPTQGKPNSKVIANNDLRNKLNDGNKDFSPYKNSNGSYSVNVVIKNKAGKGKLNINDVKFFGYNIFLNSNADDKKGIDKKEAINLLKDYENLSYDQDSVKIGDKTWSIVESSLNFKATQDIGKNKSNDVGVNKKDINISFNFTLPNTAGSNSQNFLYKITKLHFKYTFTPSDGSPEQTGVYDEKFVNPIIVMRFVQEVTLPTSNEYNGLYSTSFFSTKTKYQLDTFKFLEEEMSPYFFKANIALLLSQGVSSFIYSVDNFISTSRVKKDSLTTCYLINFSRTFNSNNLIQKLESTLTYVKELKDSKQTDRANKSVKIPVNELVFDIGENGIPEVKEFKKTYAVQTKYENTDDYKYFYFYVEKEPLHLIALSSNTTVHSTLNGYFVNRGSYLSYTAPAQVVQQICTGEALSFSDLLAGTMMTGAVFGLYNPVISLFEFGILMMQEFYILYYTNMSFDLGEAIGNASRELIKDAFRDTLYASSFISKYANAKNSYNATVQIASAQGKSGILPIKDKIYVEGVFTTQMASATESVNPNIPYFANFNLKSTSDFFNPNIKTYLTSEIESWIKLMFNDMFSLNIAYETNIMGPLAGLMFGGVNVKPINKKVTFAVKIGGEILNPLFNFQEHKLLADIPVKYFYSGDSKKIIKQIDEYLEANSQSDNEILKYACKVLKKAVPQLLGRQLDFPFIERPYLRPGQDKQATTIFKNSFCSPSLVFNSDEKTLTKYEAGTMIPSNEKSVKITNVGQNGEIYKFVDHKLKFSANRTAFLQDTNVIPDGISLLW